MDTDFDVKCDKCIKCYECVIFCTDMYLPHGFLGFIHIDESGYPDLWEDNPRCHVCEAEIDGELVNYPCNKLCKQKAMHITRW